MYESFYKLHPTPFRLTPDPHFFFESETHKRGLAYLRFAFYQREGFVAITGAPGTGKTELTLNLIEELPHNKVTLAKIVTTNLDADDLLDLVAESFQIDISNVSKGSELKKLENFFISQARVGKQVLLIIDEAHNLSVKSLIELSMLENFQLDEKPIMQCFLLGQLPLEEKLNLPELEPLKQRVIASARLDSLDQQETRDYIIHRLTKSGWKNNPTIHDEAFLFIYHFTNGVPRNINSLCNRLLLHSYVENKHQIDVDTVKRVTQEIKQESIGESLDLDFADVQTNLDFTSESQHDEDGQPVLPEELVLPEDSVLPEEIKAQQPATSNRTDSTDSTNRTNKERPQKNSRRDKRANPDDFYIPEFLRKTPDQDSAGHLSLLAEAWKPGSAPSQSRDQESPGQQHYQSSPNANAARSTSNVATAQRVAQQRTHRSSNLLDKELKFLASLAESNALATAIPATDQEPGAEKESEEILAPEEKLNPEMDTQAAVEIEPVKETPTDRKVIIDESVYDADEFAEMNDETDWQAPEKTFPKIKIEGWQQAALAVVVVGILITSIGWLYDDNPDTADVVAENQTGIESAGNSQAEPEIFSSAAPVDVELPVISSADSSSSAESNAETTPVAASDSNENETPETAIPETETSIASDTTTASATDAPIVTAKTSLTKPADSSDDPEFSAKAESTGLDTQLTQILEKTGPATPTKPTPANTANSGPDKTALSTDKPAAGSKPVAGDTAPPSTQIDSKSIAMQKNSPDPTANKSAMESQDKKATKGTAPAIAASTQQPDTNGASISMRNTGRDSITRRIEPSITNEDLTTLLSRLAAAYETGNLQQLVTTFAPDINSSEGSNRRQMLKEYQRLFNITDKRQLTIQDVQWSTKDRQILGKGDFEVLIREKGATKYTTYQGKISFAVARESNAVVIKKLDYDYGQ